MNPEVSGKRNAQQILLPCSQIIAVSYASKLSEEGVPCAFPLSSVSMQGKRWRVPTGPQQMMD